MLFPYQIPDEINPKHIKQQLEQLKAFELAHFCDYEVEALIANRSAFCDQLLLQLWQHFQLAQQPLSLIAVGGYGREELFPLSDLDFLILSEQQLSPDLQEKISQFVQFLWDCHLQVGHSVRTLEESISEGRADITIATNLLEGRFLTGNLALFEQLNQSLQQPDFWPIADFFDAKVAEKVARYQRYHNTAYNLEPDIKYSPGGLRDLHLLYWIALKHTGAKTLAQILQAGFLYPQEYEQLRQNQQFLFRMRFALHLVLKRYDNRLLFDRQLKVSELLGYGTDNLAVETMMKAFFQSLQGIALLSDLIVKHFLEHILQQDQEGEIQALDQDFSLSKQGISLRNKGLFQQQPERILDLFYHLSQHPQAGIHSATLRQLYLALRQQQGYLCELESAREKFINLLMQPKAIQHAFLPMHQYGVLNAYLPEWQGIQGLMQFDMFHTYSVDEHSLRVMLKLESFLDPANHSAHPVCCQIFPQLDPSLLYVVALFHDIAKGRGGDHAQLGALDIVPFAQKHGFDRREVETMRWLVEQHLLMSVTAQRRDIHDPEVVLAFAEQVQNQVRLDYLTCLTVADICATNETLWNSWKRSLFATLYQYSNAQFQQGMDNLLDNQEKVQQHRQQAWQLLQQQGFVWEQIEPQWQRCPEDYFLRNSPKQIAWHSQLLTELTGDLLVKVSNRFSLGGSEIFVYCRDQANLFNKVVCTIGAKKFSIHDAQIITSHDGYAFDSFIVTELDGSLLKAERRRLLEQALTQALQSDKPVRLPRLNPKLQPFQVKTEVRFLHLNKNEQTEMELFSLDKAGLLAEVSQVFSELNLNLCNAKITTIGAKAEDFFILTNAQNKALTSAEREQLQQRLLQQL